MEDNYSKREVDLIVNGIKQHITDTVVQPLSRIEAQTMKTNGRVDKLEQWKSYTAGAIAIIVMFAVPIAWKLYNSNQVNTIKINKLIK